MKFAHMGDCHLGGWRQPELKDLNFKSFQYAISRCIHEKVDFVLIAGDLFDSAYPPIETLKDSFNEFRRLKEENIPVFLIAGSHDYSVSGKTFLDVLESAGFCKNVGVYEERDNIIYLQPTIYKNIAIYGYPGKKSGLEVDEIERVKLQDAPGLFKILMLHTAIRDAIGKVPVKSVDEKALPKVNYLALAHLHINYNKENRVYSGPIFPNNLSEIEELQGGSFYIYENGIARREDIKLKDVETVSLNISNTLTATDKIIGAIEPLNLKGKIILIKLSGIIEQGSMNDIDFNKIEALTLAKGAYVFLKSTSKLHMAESEVSVDINDSIDLENQIIGKYQENHSSKFNSNIIPLMRSLQIEKLEDEKSLIFEDRVIGETKKIFQL